MTIESIVILDESVKVQCQSTIMHNARIHRSSEINRTFMVSSHVLVNNVAINVHMHA